MEKKDLYKFMHDIKDNISEIKTDVAIIKKDIDHIKEDLNYHIKRTDQVEDFLFGKDFNDKGLEGRIKSLELPVEATSFFYKKYLSIAAILTATTVIIGAIMKISSLF